MGYQVAFALGAAFATSVMGVACVWWSIIHRAIVRGAPVSQAALVLGAILDIGAFLCCSVTGASGVSGAALSLRAAGVGCSSCPVCCWCLRWPALAIGAMFATSVTGLAGVFGDTLAPGYHW